MFEVDESRLDGRFLDYFIRTPAFRDQVEAQGSTNYAAIRPNDVLAYDIRLPPLLQEQRRIVGRIKELSDWLGQVTSIRRQVASTCNALIISANFALAGGNVKSLGEVLELHEDVERVRVGENYPQVGIKSFGSGLFKKAAVSGTETT